MSDPQYGGDPNLSASSLSLIRQQIEVERELNNLLSDLESAPLGADTAQTLANLAARAQVLQDLVNAAQSDFSSATGGAVPIPPADPDALLPPEAQDEVGGMLANLDDIDPDEYDKRGEFLGPEDAAFYVNSRAIDHLAQIGYNPDTGLWEVWIRKRS